MATTQTGIVLQHLRGLVAAEQSGQRPDCELLERFSAGGEEAAFEALVGRHGPLMLGVCRRVLHDHHDAEDAFQATFLTLARRAGSVGRRGSLGCWLYRVAYHTALIVTDAADLSEIEPAAWVVQFLAEKAAEAFVGPFVLDRAHPLTEGLSLQGVIWGAGKKGNLEGFPVVMAGNIPLLADAEALAGRHILRLRLRPDISNFQDSPNWPILFTNLVQWRASALPGLSRANVRLGEDTVLTLDSAAERVLLRGSGVVHRMPGGSLCIVPVHAQQRGRLFLPFADDDPKTAEVISKVLLLARDHEIQDPLILDQIRAKP